MWRPITEAELLALVAAQLRDCSASQRQAFETMRVEPRRLPIHRLGRLEEVLVVASYGSGVIYYEDVEQGFEWAVPGADGAIPAPGCNQFELRQVLARLGL